MKKMEETEKMKYWISNEKIQFAESEANFCVDADAENNLIIVYPSQKKQEIYGFGGALTEAAAYTYYRMSKEKQAAIMEDYFGDSGNRYNFCRTHIQSCDFSLGNRAYVEDPNDINLTSFSIEQDKKYMIPFIMEALKKNRDLQLLASPWSPPAFMKTNGEMNHGGKLKKEYYAAWAKMIALYILEYQKLGINIGRITVQNEPKAVQKWESCVFTAEEEKDFACNYLADALSSSGLKNVKINIWDHNKERVFDRAVSVISDEKAESCISGIAFHWYSGDHFEALQAVRERFPEKELIFSEGCMGFSKDRKATQTRNAEAYAHDIIGNLNAGMNAYIDWNIILDEQGGPNHVKNFCDAPIMCDTNKDKIEKQLSYYYIGHFSRYIKPGARRVLVSRFTDKLEATGFVNPDGERVIVILNRRDEDIDFSIYESNMICKLKLPAHSIMTACYI